ncbi:hypothetical protein JAAARDRAFT_200532 [Jaapia argillacea MUCL 33604]|uniref:Uncharacterized protein n=1 Tax=Jaapia argillacea MUCL 33604 TaxID=933084 RepID=A0A067P4E0_9AGAM|nr:hypothetical protein JAAARDRAFT_200532 [Jaapia argillacea MUCL 33604]
MTLSIQAYPEPRFLIPLLVPFVALTGNSTFFGMVGKITWIISNIFLTSLSGVFHQGGVIPSLFHLRNLLHEYVDSGKITTADIASTSPSAFSTLSPTQDTYLIALLDATPRIPCLALQPEIFPHMNLDPLDEVWEVGLRDGLTSGMFR